MKTLRRSPADSEIVPMTATAARTAGDPVVVAGGVGILAATTRARPARCPAGRERWGAS